MGTRVTSMRLLGSPAGRGTAWQRLGHRGDAATRAGWRRPEEEEAGGGGWAGAQQRTRRLPRLWLSCWSQGDDLQPRQPPGAIPAAQPAGTPGGEGRRMTTPQHPQGHFSSPKSHPITGLPLCRTPCTRRVSVLKQMGAQPPRHSREAARPKCLLRAHAFPETESRLIIANVIAAAKEAASRSRQYPA